MKQPTTSISFHKIIENIPSSEVYVESLNLFETLCISTYATFLHITVCKAIEQLSNLLVKIYIKFSSLIATDYLEH